MSTTENVDAAAETVTTETPVADEHK